MQSRMSLATRNERLQERVSVSARPLGDQPVQFGLRPFGASATGSRFHQALMRLDHVHGRRFVAAARQQISQCTEGDLGGEEGILDDLVAGGPQQRGGIG